MPSSPSARRASHVALEPPREAGLSWRALAWLAIVGGWFFGAYGFCNWFTEQRGQAGHLWWEWERRIPFVPAFIVPYMSLDLFYAGAPFLCRTRQELNLLGQRLFTVTTLSCLCFLAFPLEFGWPRPMPDPSSWSAPIFQLLHAGDKPYNLAPSLHISLRCLIWITYARHLRGWCRRVTKFWFILIGLSTLLVWQHHLIDVITGFLAAYLVARLLPDRSQPVERSVASTTSRVLMWRYAAAALMLALPALLGGGFLWFLWPAAGFGLAALAYATGDPRWWQKSGGALTPAAEWVFLPLILVAKLGRRPWRKGAPQWHELTPGVFFGRRPAGRDQQEFEVRAIGAVLDLTSESTLASFVRERCVWRTLPVLDLLPPSPVLLAHAVAFVREHESRRVLIHCELGLSRSACVAAAWLLASDRAMSVEEAMTAIGRIEPRSVLSDEHAIILRTWREGTQASGLCGQWASRLL